MAILSQSPRPGVGSVTQRPGLIGHLFFFFRENSFHLGTRQGWRQPPPAQVCLCLASGRRAGAGFLLAVVTASFLQGVICVWGCDSVFLTHKGPSFVNISLGVGDRCPGSGLSLAL